MTRIPIHLPVLLALLVLASPLWAEPQPAPGAGLADSGVDLDWLSPPPGLVFTPSTGNWLEYRLTDLDAKVTRRFTLACIGQDSHRGRMGSWLELTVSSRNETPVVIQALMAFSSDGRNQVLRLIVRAGNFHSVEYPIGSTPSATSGATPGPANWTELGEETLTVAGGSFATQIYRVERPDKASQKLWISPSLSPFGVVRVVSLSHELELVAYGRDYPSRPMPDPYPLTPTAAPTTDATP